MRYLPTLEVRGKMIQVALPDVHGIALAEAALTSGHNRIEKLQKILLSSPMLLYWAVHIWRLKPESTEQIQPSPAEFANALVDVVKRHCADLFRDHAEKLTSIERIEIEQFVDYHAYFMIKEESATDFPTQIETRVALLDSLFPPSEPHTRRNSAEVDHEAILAEFKQSDFSNFVQRHEILSNWNLALPFFGGGLGDLDQRLQRIEVLEREFAAEVEKAKLAAMRQLAYGASHEVNNPLANISTRAQALLRDETDPKRRQRLQTIDAQAFRAHDMISNLMTFARPPSPVCSRFQLIPLVQKAIEPLLPTANAQQTSIEVEVESAIYIVADERQVAEMIFALVQNSLESIRQNGKIRIKAQLPIGNQPVCVDVIDDGPGISAEVRQHIFDPFFSGREAGRGLGFGLSKVWRLMELHNGKVEVLDQFGLTCIRLQFPPNQAESSKMGIGKTA